jgi:hypothetical protein
MRQAITVLKTLLIIILILNLSLWLFSHGSGHSIPLKTDLKFGITAFSLLFLLTGVIYFGRNKDRRK